MRTIFSLFVILFASAAFAGKSYQVTGEVLEVSDSKIVLSKAGEKFEIDRAAGTKVSGDLKKGGKATVYYTMTAEEIESKEGGSKDKKKK